VLWRSGRSRSSAYAARGPCRVRARPRWAPASPGCHDPENPAAQSLLASAASTSRARPPGMASATGSASGAARGAVGAGPLRQARQYGVNTVYGRPSRVRIAAGSKSRLAEGTTTAWMPMLAKLAATASSSSSSSGSDPAAHTTVRAPAARASSGRAVAGSPCLSASCEPRRRSSPSRAAKDFHSHQRAAAPGAQQRRSRGSQTNAGRRSPPSPRARAMASVSAGLSPRRRSRRNQKRVVCGRVTLAFRRSIGSGLVRHARVHDQYGRSTRFLPGGPRIRGVSRAAPGICAAKSQSAMHRGRAS